MDKQQLSARFAEYFEAHMDEILADLAEIIAIESIGDENAEVKPFGEGSAKALAWGEGKLRELGMATRNFDNYAVRGDFSAEGEPVLGILAHLDTVPVSSGWSYDPFKLTEKDGVLYGRGTIDDKGPATAVIWAVKAIREMGLPMRNFRVIFGGNEENGCNDMAYYEKCEKFPPMVFTPDGSFPVLNCEKGMIHLTFSAPYEDSEISSINAGMALNAIPDRCSVTCADGRKVLITGQSAHGSRPENGENSITKFLAGYEGSSTLLGGLKKLFPHGEFDGSSCGLGFEDKISGKMTCALTVLKTEGGKLCGGIDIRFPIDRTLAEIKGIIEGAVEKAGFTIDTFEGMEPHYVDENSEFVQALLRVYERVKGEKGYCIAEGGVTYVHNTEGAVAFGAEFPWENNNMHGDDEHISMETFRLNLNMYANAIAEICMKE
ncbi:M20/M25/M40 family metallo-hydrolase [Ruminococcus sp.]|uniref:M20/M25/M40 family metallo-hydrolase n=1 Tax=Ruminococcus sp. TaxID=41978 RepID=UPI0025E68A1B|nr:M20/M25/M40 family metallo-hydrolase [Ruminococcus sp.]MBQ8966984.1 M20/M25/M40 family metallo-hydrolase [Ruminococcus sp.]